MTGPSEYDIAQLRRQGDLRSYLQQLAGTAAQRCAEHRRQVLAQPDLAERLIGILQLARPDQWSGYLPPEHDATGLLNRSSIRAGLLEIVAAAEGRGGHDHG